MKALILILLLLAPRAPAAEFPAYSGPLVRVWQSQDGLPGNVVRSVVQSEDGFLWVATAEGVARFDGFDFEWIEAADGEVRRSRLAFSRLFAGTGGRVWAATYQGALFRSDNGALVRILENVRGPSPPLVTQLLDEPDGSAHFLHGDHIKRISPDGEVTVPEPSPALSRRFEEDLQQRATGGRMPDEAGNLVLHDRSGGIWISGSSGGITVRHPGQAERAVILPQVGKAYGINELFEDREGNVWLACRVNGLVRVRRARVESLDLGSHLSERAVTALMEDSTGAWWIAHRQGGITRWTPEGSQVIPLTRSRHMRPAAALFEDRDSRLWAASRDGTVFRFQEGEFTPQFTQTQVPSKVRSITGDSLGNLWFGGSQGISSLTGETVRRFGKSDGVAAHDVTVLQPFPGGRIIAGTTAGTILLGDGDGFRTIAGPEILKHQWISGILPVSARETWVSTLGSGLYLWNGREWFGFDADAGLPDSRLTCVLDDGAGHLWMGSLSGIIRVGRVELLARINAPEIPLRWLRLDHTDGLPSRECVGGYQPAGWRAKDGQLWFPTGNGVARVRPDVAAPNPVPPPVYLRKVRVNGVEHPLENGPIQPARGRARVEFHFIGLNLAAPEKTTYRSRLKGLDDAWRELGSQRMASFEAIPPGDYTFEVTAVNGDGLASTQAAGISLIIRPNYWETGWFYASVGAFVLSIAMVIGWTAARMRLKDRIMALKVRGAREGERSRIARDLHDDLGASLTEISILSSLAAEDATASTLCDPLHQLSIKAKHAVGRLDEIVWAVNPRQDNLRSLVDYISAFAREFLDLADIPLRMEVTRGIPAHPLPAARRHGVFLTVREALNNIVKHAGATGVSLNISFANRILEIRVEDNGHGFSPDYANTGEGLGNLRQRMRDAGGDCQIGTKLGHGTTVLITLPLYPANKPVS